MEYERFFCTHATAQRGLGMPIGRLTGLAGPDYGVQRTPGNFGLVRTVAKDLRHKLGDYANNPTHIFTEPRVGYRLPRGEERRL